MKFFTRLFLSILLIFLFLSLQGQESLFPSSNEFPSFTPFSEEYINTYIEKAKECLYNGDLKGVESNIEILKDLNINGDPRISGMIQNHSGILEYYKGNIAEALQYYLNALSYYNESGQTEGLNILMNNIAIIFVQIQDLESTIKYLQKALAYTSENDINRRSVYLLNLAETEALRGNYQKGIKIANELLDLYNYDQVDFSNIAIYGILIYIYNNIDDNKNTIKYIDIGMELITPETSYLDLQSFYSRLIEYYFKIKDYEKVLRYGKIIYPPPDSAYFHELRTTINMMAVAARETNDFNYALLLDSKANEIEYGKAPLNKEDIINPLLIQYSHQRDIKDKSLMDMELQENNAHEQIQRRFLRNLIILLSIMSFAIALVIRTSRIRIRYQENLRLKHESLHKINEELASNNRNLENENRTLDTLISIFAHDLINPFQALLGFSQLMIKDQKILRKEDFIEYSNILSETSFQLNQLLTNLNSMAIVQDTKSKPEKESFEIKIVIKNICKLFEGSLKKKDIRIDYETVNNHRIKINKGIFEAVLRNIISNAIKFSNRNSKILLSSTKENNQLILKVTDYGIGIPENLQAELLALGYPESRTGTSNERGSGIGLAICIELLETTNASLEIESKEHHGTTIILKMPLKNG